MTMEQKTPEVRMTIEGHICLISLDNASKKNAITPEVMSQLSTHLTTFEDDDNLWVAITDPAGEHTTAGLDMPKFFGPTATAKPIPRSLCRSDDGLEKIEVTEEDAGGHEHDSIRHTRD